MTKYKTYVASVCETLDTFNTNLNKFKKSKYIGEIRRRKYNTYTAIVGLSKNSAYEVKHDFAGARTITRNIDYCGIKIAASEQFFKKYYLENKIKQQNFQDTTSKNDKDDTLDFSLV